jgi:opacity protein-like surface antigen
VDNLVKTSKNTLIITILSMLAAFPASADQFGGFQRLVDRPSLKPFTRDLGSLLGAATFHNGRSLGYSGFDAGIRGAYRFSPEPGNKVLRDAGVKGFGMPWVQAEIGLPLKLDGYIRGISFQGLTIAGGGLRYGLRQTDKKMDPQLLLAISAHSVAHRHFSASHFGANVIISIAVNDKFDPYFGIGLDRTRLVVRTIPTLDTTLEGESAETLTSRVTLGASFRPKPYLYLHAGTTLTHGRLGLDSGVGIRF